MLTTDYYHDHKHHHYHHHQNLKNLKKKSFFFFLIAKISTKKMTINQAKYNQKIDPARHNYNFNKSWHY